MNAKRSKGNKGNRKRSSQKNRQKNTTPKSAPKSAPEQSRARRWLGLAVMILGIGLLARYVLSNQKSASLADVKARLAKAQQSQNFPETEKIAREWLRLDPMSPEPWEAAAEAAIAMSQPVAAVEYLNGIPEPKPLNDYLQLGYLEMEALGQPLQCLETCRETLSHYPKDPESHERLLYIYTMTAQRDRAFRQARETIDLGCERPATYAYLLTAKWIAFKNGYEMNNRWLEQSPDEELFQVATLSHLRSYPMLDVLAREQSPPGQTLQPIEFRTLQVMELRELFPQNPELLSLELDQLCQAAETEQVAERLALVTDDMGQDSRFWRYKGWYYAATDQMQKAEQSLLRALELDPFDWASYLEMASLKRRTEGIEAATVWQTKGDFGKKLVNAIQKSPSLQYLEPESLYDDIATYFEMCDQGALAVALQECLRR